MKSTVVDESLSSFKPMYCSREYQASTRLIQQYEKSTLNNTVHHLSKELTALSHDRNFFIIMFQLRSHLATLQSGVNSVKIDILSILNQVLVISLQMLKPALLNPSDLKLLLTKLANQLVSHTRLALL